VTDVTDVKTSVTLEEIDTVQTFVENLARIEPPSQIVAALKDPLLQKFMMLKTSPDSASRLEFWLERYFEDEIDLIEQGFGMSPSLSDVLRGLATYTEATKVFLSPTSLDLTFRNFTRPLRNF
jgi:centromere protein I